MPRVFPFEGLVYDPMVVGALGRVTAPPYDVISDDRLRELRASPHNMVHVDLGGDGDPAYARAAGLLDAWRREGALVPTGSPAFYPYEMRTPAAERVRGVICAMELRELGDGVVPHERTASAPVRDRLQLLRATRAHLSAVYGTIDGPSAPLAELLDAVVRSAPRLEARDDEGVRHRLWSVPPDERVAEWLAGERFLIADGHHRYVTALRYRDEMRAAHGPGPWDRILAFVVDAATERPPVLPYHRIQLEGPPPAVSGEPAGDLGSVLDAVSDEELVVGVATPRRGGGADVRLLQLEGEAPAVRALHLGLLNGLVPPQHLRFRPDANEAVEAVASGAAVAAYLLPPTTPDRIRKVVERGERLPQKSTYFWPKPRTGMIVMPIDGPGPVG